MSALLLVTYLTIFSNQKYLGFVRNWFLFIYVWKIKNFENWSLYGNALVKQTLKDC